MSKPGWSTGGWTRPSTKSKSKPAIESASRPLRGNSSGLKSSDALLPIRHAKTHHRSEYRNPTTPAPKPSNRTRRVTPEDRLAKERERERERRNNETAAAKSKATPVFESRSSNRSAKTRLKSETKLSKQKSRKKSALPGTDTPPVSEEEYSNLPVQIQRKYFSDLERLHIAYSSVHQAQTSASSTSTSSALKPPSTSRSSAHRHYHPQSSTQTQSPAPHLYNLATTTSQHVQPRRSQHIGVNYSQASFADVLTSQAEAQWYNTLPDKVRHQLFSIEEQDVLAETLQPIRQLKSAKPDTADRIASRAARHSRKAASSPYISSSDESDQNLYKSRPRRHDKTAMAALRKRSDTELPTYNRNSIIHRSNSPHGLPWDSQAPPLPAPKAPLLTTHRRSKSFATLASATRPSCDATAVTTDPEAVYYRNPEARHKLRQYLASPQRFDEALTFGFPSESSPEYPHSFNTRTTSAHTHYDTASSSIEIPELDDFGSYDASDTGTDSPATPADADFSWRASKFNRVSIFGSLDADSIPSFDLKFASEKPKLEPVVLMAPPLMNREMTLRMTLTRPDLRANEEEMYGYSRPASNEDPLALDQLPTPIEDISGNRGAFAVPSPVKDYHSRNHTYEPSPTTWKSAKGKEGNGFSRFFKKLRGH